MSLSLDLEKNILQNSKIPKWLKARGVNFSQRPPTLDEMDSVLESREGEADARDIIVSKPPTNFRAYKKAKKQIAEAEELHDWIEKKGKKETETGETKVDDFLDSLESVLNQMS